MTETPNGIFEWIWFIATEYSELFINGTILTLIIAVSGTILGFILGFIVGIAEDSNDKQKRPFAQEDNSWLYKGSEQGLC